MANEFKRTQTYGFIRDLFAIDARALAVVRILIAAIVFVVAIYALQEPETVENSIRRGHWNNPNKGTLWSVYWLGHGSIWQWFCAGINIVASICLLVGFKTFFATAACLVLTWSFQVDNPLGSAPGYDLLRMGLFWGLFLPWGSCWSVDTSQYRDPRPAKWSVVSFGTAGIMLQLAYVYFFSGLTKLFTGWDGTSLARALRLDDWFGSSVVEQPTVLGWFIRLVLAVEILGTVLLFVPYVHQFWRGVMVAFILVTHISIAVMFSTGIFPFVSLAVWIIFVPSLVWNMALGRPDQFEVDQLEENPGLQRGCQGLCLVFVLFVLALNINNILQIGKKDDVSDSALVMRNMANITMTKQEFKLFALSNQTD